jgi:antitoxin (DNA-binding transcriptional repressor) of toxin-antitoxin stability system
MRARRISISAAESGMNRILVWVKAGREFIVCRARTPIVQLIRPAGNIASMRRIPMHQHHAKARRRRLAGARFRDRC